tara:strand:- start:225 stop:740 length:516 start_codon:yes stop_codon:yes gene_type:complete
MALTRLNMKSSDLPSGSPLQVKTATKTDTQSTTSGSFEDITGLSISITPSSTSNKILVFCSVFLATTFYWAPIRILRDSVQVNAPNAGASNQPLVNGIASSQAAGNYIANTVNVSALDSPSSTSALTYKIQFILLNNSGKTWVNRTERDENNVLGYDTRGSSSLTVMEIAG